MDPRDLSTIAFSEPTDEEAQRLHMWRFWRHIPRQGRVTIFDRTWYGRVLVERVEKFCATEDGRSRDKWQAYHEAVLSHSD